MPPRKRNKAGQSTSTVSLVHRPSVYIGPCSAASSKSILAANSITHVLSVGATPAQEVDGVIYHRISLSDSPSSSISKVCDSACDIIQTALKSKANTGKILVHCSAGISRSPTVVAAYLMKRCNTPLKAALKQIVQARPQVSPNAGFLQQLKDLEMELFGSESLVVDELPKREKDRLALFAEETETAEAALEVDGLEASPSATQD